VTAVASESGEFSDLVPESTPENPMIEGIRYGSQVGYETSQILVTLLTRYPTSYDERNQSSLVQLELSCLRASNTEGTPGTGTTAKAGAVPTGTGTPASTTTGSAAAGVMASGAVLLSCGLLVAGLFGI
jgi:hypothetical protein